VKKIQDGVLQGLETSIYHLPLTVRLVCGLCVKLNSKCIHLTTEPQRVSELSLEHSAPLVWVCAGACAPGRGGPHPRPYTMLGKGDCTYKV